MTQEEIIADANKTPLPTLLKHYSLQKEKGEPTATTICNAMEDYARKILDSKINTPEINDFIEGVKTEAAHQTERWGIENEQGNPPHHYSMVLMKLAGKLCVAIWERDTDKFKHHCITIAAAMHNCHRQINKEGTEINKWFYKH